MTCTPTALAAAARCYEDLPTGDMSAIMVQLLCSWAEKDVENPLAPCQLAISLGPPGTVVLTWFDPVQYDSIEVWHILLVGGPSHIETTLAGNAVTWTTPILQPGDYFLVRGVIGDDKSGWSYSGPCDGR